MEALVYSLLKEKKTEELILEINQNLELLDFVDSKGVSLLMLSYYFSNKELREFILQHRKPKNIYEAVTCGVKELVIQYLDEQPLLINAHSADGFTPLGLAAYFGRVEIAQFLIQSGADPNIAAANVFRVAPLHSSVAANNYEITKLLLEHGADPNAKQQQNITALHGSAHLGNAKITALLLQYGADKNVSMDNGKAPYDLARDIHAEELMRLLS